MAGEQIDEAALFDPLVHQPVRKQRRTQAIQSRGHYRQRRRQQQTAFDWNVRQLLFELEQPARSKIR
jgi:hypothetical protein